ncbi:hypothetical protein [Mesorhizobium sp. ES1-4]|uniref:hypothetical protein n=1 Tax=Mesorhizobium sp. ES1-4 TaxID=2876627 RepID=UPI001CC910AE|nr:hypothetical protein [Mesorhizobium sp. ES1-4]MBZ9798799.1 hypothetical protein [Mesorhizobium sp. ES1-4]
MDKMIDVRQCTILGAGTDIFILYFGSSDPQWICLSKHDFPGRTGAFRVDSNIPVSTNEQGCAPATPTLVKQLMSGSQLTTRAVTFPDDFPVDRTGSLLGLREAFGLVAHIRAQH